MDEERSNESRRDLNLTLHLSTFEVFGPWLTSDEGSVLHVLVCISYTTFPTYGF